MNENTSEISDKLTPQELIICLYGLSKQEKLAYSQMDIHNFLYSKKIQGITPFTDLEFKWDGPYPICPEIQRVYDNLRVVGLLNMNLPLLTHIIAKDCRGYFDRNIKNRLSNEKLAELEQIAKEFSELSLEKAEL
ncbi:hypothetical protein HYX17_01015 [Candidatus Woesearchaeota archaeon]|nr:hypothetical protein [Candidatus Woesearchaeota archaeon]